MTQKKNKVAIITGAGAVENAWYPILSLLKILPCEVDADVANSLFANYIYLLRTYSKYSDKKSVENLKIELEQVKTLKELICYKIKQYQQSGILKARKEFKKILSRFVFTIPDSEFGLVTTNWDTAIDIEINKIVKEVYVDVKSAKCFHLHGSVDSPDHLYLPSETSHENYRTDEENKKYGLDHYHTLQFLKEADQLILYGISLDPLDAELCQILNGTFSTSSNLKEIIIINPDHGRVKKRVKFLIIPSTHIKIKCFKPENLINEV